MFWQFHDILLSHNSFDETFILDCYKGRKLDNTINRAPVSMVQKQKKGISSEYVCICIGIQRKEDALAATINRAKPMQKNSSAYLKAIS